MLLMLISLYVDVNWKLGQLKPDVCQLWLAKNVFQN